VDSPGTRSPRSPWFPSPTRRLPGRRGTPRRRRRSSPARPQGVICPNSQGWWLVATSGVVSPAAGYEPCEQVLSTHFGRQTRGRTHRVTCCVAGRSTGLCKQMRLLMVCIAGGEGSYRARAVPDFGASQWRLGHARTRMLSEATLTPDRNLAPPPWGRSPLLWSQV